LLLVVELAVVTMHQVVMQELEVVPEVIVHQGLARVHYKEQH
tara:strand:+ start:33 stop:158 length:126 start_codon:yes stop_codon:yes gene_type:complete